MLLRLRMNKATDAAQPLHAEILAWFDCLITFCLAATQLSCSQIVSLLANLDGLIGAEPDTCTFLTMHVTEQLIENLNNGKVGIDVV